MIEFEQRRSFVFTGHDRRRLVTALARADHVKLFRRWQAVLQVVEGRSVREAAHFAGVDRSTVHRWLQTYQQSRRPEDLHDEVRPGRPREADDRDEELLTEVLAQDPRTLGYRATGWTAPLLTTYLTEPRVRVRGVGAHAAPLLRAVRLVLEAVALCLWPA